MLFVGRKFFTPPPFDGDRWVGLLEEERKKFGVSCLNKV